MAPITRHAAHVSNSLPENNLEEASKHLEITREASWQFPESEQHLEREMSEEPASSYDETELLAQMDGEGDGEDHGKAHSYDVSGGLEDVLHPLREAANRVGREVERFAEVLDRYNPLRATSEGERHEMTTEVIEQYHTIAVEAVHRLKARHSHERQKEHVSRPQRRQSSVQTSQDSTGMDVDNVVVARQGTTTLEDLENWEQEAQTWDLLRRLVEVRFPRPESDKAGREKDVRHLHQYSTEKELWGDFLKSNEVAFEQKTVLQWLKDTAQEQGEDIDVLVHDLQQSADRGDIVSHGWLHTKAAIKNHKRLNASPNLNSMVAQSSKTIMNTSRTEHLVTHLDPDAPSREGHKLEAQDEYFERAIWRGCYELLRRGASIVELKEWCLERTEVWRALSMSGGTGESSNGDYGTDSIEASSLWRRMSYMLARQGGCDEYERAVYGLLSGDMDSVEPVCQSWDDFIFVRYNAYLKAQYAAYLQWMYTRRSSSATDSVPAIFNALPPSEDPKTAIIDLIEEMKTNPRTSEATKHPMKMLQGVLIANRFDHFIYQQGLALAHFANAMGESKLIPPMEERPENPDINEYVTLEDHDGLRVFAHVLLIFINLGIDLGGAQQRVVVENIVVAYISFLRLAGKEELIPLYCSQLSGNRRYATLSRSLIDITDHEQRVTHIRLIRELGLDVQEFVRFQSRLMFADHPERDNGYPAAGNFRLMEHDPSSQGPGMRIKKDFMGDDPDRVERTDMLLVRSLEWYLLIDGLWSETFMIGTMLYLRFFKHMHLTAARMLATKVPSSEISRSKTNAIIGESVNLFAPDIDLDEEDLTEVLDCSLNKKAVMKQHLLAEAKTYRDLEILIEALDHIETLGSVQELHNEGDDIQWQKGWRQQLARGFKPANASVQPLLKGWLLATPWEDDEFRQVREAYLPETILAYVSILQFAGETLTRDFLLECMDLAAMIATEGSDLMDVFLKTRRVQDLVEAFVMASKKLLIETSAKSGVAKQSKKLRARGWSHELWSVKTSSTG